MKSQVLKHTRKVRKAFFEYETNKIVQINSKTIGILLRFFQLVMIVYFVGYVMIYMGGYQDRHGLTSSVVVKVKGVGYAKQTRFHRKVWDISDMVVPPQENKAVFITTNAIETANQTQSTCAENPTVPGALCQNDSTCEKDKVILLGNGVMTGRCIAAGNGIKTCEIMAWCPLENDTLTDPQRPLLKEVTNFTILVKNSIIFDELNVQRSNLFFWERKVVPKNCLYNPKDPLLKFCPIFQISTLLGPLNNHDLTQLLTYGGIVQVIITWNCNLDFFRHRCNPEYSFNRLDPKNVKLSKGWNFRYSNYYIHNDTEYRMQYKVFGLRILFEVRGKARKFSATTFTMNLGSGLALLAVATFICDFIIIFILPKRENYFNSVYEVHKDDDAYQDEDNDEETEPVKKPITEVNP